MNALERVDISDISAQEFARIYRSGEGRPVVVTGALAGLESCSLEWIQAMLPPEKFPARHYGPDHFAKPKTEWKKYSDLKQVTPAEYTSLLLDGTAHREHIYFAQVPIGDTDLGRRLDPAISQIASHCGLRPVVPVNLWWGPGGHTEPLHYDSGDGTLAQLHGEKRVVLFPPSQSRNLYPFPVRSKGIAPWISQVYIDHPDFDAFPRMRDALAHKVEVTLRPGELLFIPANWWHEVTAISDGWICSINRFWKVEPVMRLFSIPLSLLVYGVSMAMLSVAGRKKIQPRVAPREEAV